MDQLYFLDHFIFRREVFVETSLMNFILHSAPKVIVKGICVWRFRGPLIFLDVTSWNSFFEEILNQIACMGRSAILHINPVVARINLANSGKEFFFQVISFRIHFETILIYVYRLTNSVPCESGRYHDFYWLTVPSRILLASSQLRLFTIHSSINISSVFSAEIMVFRQ